MLLKFCLVATILHGQPGSTDWVDTTQCQRCVVPDQSVDNSVKKKKRKIEPEIDEEYCRVASEKPNSKRWERLRETYCREYTEKLEEENEETQSNP